MPEQRPNFRQADFHYHPSSTVVDTFQVDEIRDWMRKAGVPTKRLRKQSLRHETFRGYYAISIRGMTRRDYGKLNQAIDYEEQSSSSPRPYAEQRAYAQRVLLRFLAGDVAQGPLFEEVVSVASSAMDSDVYYGRKEPHKMTFSEAWNVYQSLKDVSYFACTMIDVMLNEYPPGTRSPFWIQPVHEELAPIYDRNDDIRKQLDNR